MTPESDLIPFFIYTALIWFVTGFESAPRTAGLLFMLEGGI